MPRKLKVFRTAAGFHDAYVAAPSRKAALAAWGAERDLFARGAAEEVTDPALMEEPLAHPGAVIKRSRGSAAEQLAALPADTPTRKRAKKVDAPATEAVAPAPTSKRVPKPSRDALDAAEAAIEQAERAFAEERRQLARRLRALEAERARATVAHERRLAALKSAREAASAEHRRDMDAWRRAAD